MPQRNENTGKWRPRRGPLNVARVLASRYGHDLDPVIYTKGVAISGRLRLANLDPGSYDPVEDIVRIAGPYASGARPMFDAKCAGAEIAGVIWADELAQRTSDNRYSALLLEAANRFTSLGQGQPPPPCEQDFRVEDIFFAATVMGRAFALTRDGRYADMLAGFLLAAPTQRPDGLFQHAQFAPYCWGRGNGFAALGFSEALTYLPNTHTSHSMLLARHVKHIDALLRYQAPSGMLRQVIHLPESYEELSATCMTGYAIARGIRMGWLDNALLPSLRRAWDAAASHIGDDGSVRDVCVGTGVQSSLQAYLDRPTVSGFDDRGGALALWFATELQALARQL